MPSSMTGFGRAERSAGDLRVTVEARSVNNRYLNVKMRLPPRFLRHEAKLEEEVRKAMARGTVEVHARVRGGARRSAPLVDAELARGWVTSIEGLAGATGLPLQLDLQTVLQLPGVLVLEEAEEVQDEELEAVRGALRAALAELTAARAEEGARLARELHELLDAAGATAAAIAARAPEIPQEYRRRLHQRIGTLLQGGGVSLDPGLLEKEVALFADRSDATEELARLASHAEGFRQTLGRNGPIGRALDFLVQEMAREANTIGSKNQDADLARSVVELKTAIERMREQVQNLE